MYKITSEGKIVTYTDKSPYVKIVDGYSKPCPITQAQGIAAGGNCYNLIGQTEAFPGRPVAWVHQVDSGEELSNSFDKINEAYAKLAELQRSNFSLGMSIEEIEEALCDIDKGDA